MLRIFKCMLVLMVATLYGSSCVAFMDIYPLESISPAAAYNPCSDIRNGQFVCLDCSTLAFCVQEGGDWVTFEYDTCRTDKSLYCNEEAKGCTIQRECLLPKRGIRFECQNAGMYPDPYDCKLYHNCNNFNEDTRVVCPSGRAYSVADKDCTLNAGNSDVCKQAQYQCNRAGDMGAWPNDENIYYVCRIKPFDGKLVLYPLLYRCPSGKIFDGQRCVTVNQIDQPNQSDEKTFGCTKGKLLPHESNCRAYYSCKNGNKVLEQCPQNTYFNAKREYCEFGQC